MSVADQINRIKTNIASTYTAAQAKGATMPQTQNSDNLADCVQSITTGGGTQFGLTAEQMLGTLDSEGNLTYPALPSITFTGLESIPASGFCYKFYARTFETGSTISFPDLTTINDSGLSNAFATCQGITSLEFGSLESITGNYGLSSCFFGSSLTSASFPKLKTILSTNGMSSCFSSCAALTSISFPLLESASGSALSNTFSGCDSLTSASFPKLNNTYLNGTFSGCSALTSVSFGGLTTTVANGFTNTFKSCVSLTSVDFSVLSYIDESTFNTTFSGCTALTTISFPALTYAASDAFGFRSSAYAFLNCTALTEIHFPASMQTSIEATTGYADKWGAPNATIYFSL